MMADVVTLSINGKPVSVSPRMVVTGTTLETTANNLWSEDRFNLAADSTGGDRFTNNPHKGLYRPHVTPYFNNTDITDQDGKGLSGQSDTRWALFGNPSAPQGSCLTIGFLDGKETPYVDSAETQFNVPGGLQIRSYLDWAVAMHIEEMAVDSTGAG